MGPRRKKKWWKEGLGHELGGEFEGEAKGTNLGNSVASFSEYTPTTAASTMFGCCSSKASISAGGTMW